jgi:hypothetical protein
MSRYRWKVNRVRMGAAFAFTWQARPSKLSRQRVLRTHRRRALRKTFLCLCIRRSGLRGHSVDPVDTFYHELGLAEHRNRHLL